MVDDRIEQGVSEIIRAHFANGAPWNPDPRPDRIEDIELCFFLEGNEKVFSQKHTDLLAAHDLTAIEVKHVSDEEKVVVVLLNLWALEGIENVFQGQRVQIKLRTEGAQDPDIAEAVDVDPGNALVVEMRQKLPDVLDHALFQVDAVEFDEGNDRLAPHHFLLQAKGAGRFARNWFA